MSPYPFPLHHGHLLNPWKWYSPPNPISVSNVLNITIVWELIFFYLLRTFFLILVVLLFCVCVCVCVCVLFLLSLCFSQISPLAFFRWKTWSKTWGDRQQLWKAVITGDTVTRLSIPIRGHGKNHLKKARGEIWPKRSERRNNTKKKLPRWGKSPQ